MKALSVLVVDDDADFAHSFGDLIRFYGHDVTVASSAEEAVSIARQAPKDLVFLDIRMPLVSGLEIYPKLRATMPSACIVFFTAFIDDVDRRSSTEVFYAELLEKPGGIGRLEQVLRRVAGEFELLLVGADESVADLRQMLCHRGYKILRAKTLARAEDILLTSEGERVSAVVGNDTVGGRALMSLDEALSYADMALPIISINADGGASAAATRPQRLQRLSAKASMKSILDAIDRGAEQFVF